MYGVMEFIKKCNNNDIKPIVGLDIGNGLLFTKNYEGYQNLLKISTIKSERELVLDDLVKYSDNLICFTNEDELKAIYDESYPNNLRKTLCLNDADLEILKYLHMLRDNKNLSMEYNFDNDVCYKKISDNRYEEFINKCNLVLPKYELNLPDYCKYNDTKGLNADDYLESLSIAGLNKRLNNRVSSEYKERLLYELSVIKKMGFSNYFLIVYDYIKFAKTNKILVGPGRGSAAGSLVSFSLGITEVDPIKYNLLFERFLNSERITMPDIDTDFPDNKRDEVINYVIDKYGKKNVSGVSTFGTFGIKMALRDIGRVMNIPLYVIDDLSKKIGSLTTSEISNNSELMKYINSDNKLKKLFSICIRIEGLPRHSSIHAAGIIMANSPLDDIIPLVLDNNRYLSSYEAMYLEDLGLLKMDFLGLKNLTIIDNILKTLEKEKKITLKFSDIPLDDEMTNQVFCNGDTEGIFQFESSGMKDFLVRLHPDSFTDVFNANAFFRPGPSSNIDSFIKRKFNKEKIDYFDDSLMDILKETKGIIVYQEQIMRIANTMASFTLGEADILRRAMSKKKLSDITKFQDKFINNSIKNGYDKEKASEIFNLILNFASYGFNKSHSVAYSIISYKMAYLKAHYPLYFYLSLLNSSEMDEVKTKKYLQELKSHNLKVSKPDINKSNDNYVIHYDTIYLPFKVIKGINSVISNKLIEVRNDKFNDIYDFFSKLAIGSIPKNVSLSLIKSGTLDSFEINRKTIYENLDNLINYGNLVKDLGSENVLKPEIINYPEFTKEELISFEKECFGFYLSNHPVVFYRSKLKNAVKVVDLKKYFNKNITTILLVDRIKETKTKDNLPMAFIEGSDEESVVDVIVFPKVYETISNLKKGGIIKVEGRVERKKNYNIIASTITLVKESL
jgi:DNA polymerase-3 subunit alpha